VTGMKILQLFNRETESENSKINDNTKKHGSKQSFTTPFSFQLPIYLLLTLGFIIFYGGIKILNGDNFTTFGDLFSQCL
jgi:ABC-type multidrug transport system fused ATPase/permease subunit